jgi:hypothetical protein
MTSACQRVSVSGQGVEEDDTVIFGETPDGVVPDAVERAGSGHGTGIARRCAQQPGASVDDLSPARHKVGGE